MIRIFALVYGIAFTAVALLGLGHHGMSSETSNLLGVFPINGLHNMVHLLIGVAGVLVYFAGAAACLMYARIVGIVYTIVGILGFIDPTTFGLMPIGGADIALHLLAGAIALFFGFAKLPVQAMAHRADPP